MGHRFTRHVFTALIGLGVIGCGSGMTFDPDFDPAHDFSRYRTFFWATDQAATGDARLDNPLLDARIRSAVDQQLTAIGLIKAEGRQGDIGVRYHVVLEESVRTETFNEAYAELVWRGPPRRRSTPTTTTTLVGKVSASTKPCRKCWRPTLDGRR